MADLQGAFINLAKSVEEDPPELENTEVNTEWRFLYGNFKRLPIIHKLLNIIYCQLSEYVRFLWLRPPKTAT